MDGLRLDSGFHAEQVQQDVFVRGDVAEVPRELVQHQSGRDAGGVDGTAGRAGSGLGFGRTEQG